MAGNTGEQRDAFGGDLGVGKKAGERHSSNRWHKRKRIAVDWQAITVIVFIIAGMIGWSISVEVRIAQHASVETLSQRIKNIEDVMTPVLIDWKVQQELRKYDVSKKYDLTKLGSTGSLSLSGSDQHNSEKIKEAAKKWAEKKIAEDKIRIEEDSRKWAEDRVQQRN